MAHIVAAASAAEWDQHGTARRSTHPGDKYRLYAVGKNQPLYILYRSKNLWIFHRFPALLIARQISP